jgi:hypothetical protein
MCGTSYKVHGIPGSTDIKEQDSKIIKFPTSMQKTGAFSLMSLAFVSFWQIEIAVSFL